MFGLGKKNAEIDAFAVDVCRELVRRFPPSREPELARKDKKAGVTLGNALGEMERRVIAFQAAESLGVYGKARLLRSIGDEMTRLQYGAALVKAAQDLLVKAPVSGKR